MTNLFALLADNFPKDDRVTFATMQDGTHVTYGQLQKRSAQYADLLCELGVKHGDRVAIQVDKSIEMLMLYLGCLRAGAVFLPLNTSYTSGELAYFLEDAAPRLFVCSPQVESEMRTLAASKEVSCVETLDGTGGGSLAEAADDKLETFATVDCADHDLAAILYTSGTTGRSKGAMLSHGNLASNCFTLRDYWQFGSSDTLLHALPIFHTHGLFVATNVTLAAGASMVFLPGFDIDHVLANLPSSTVMMGVPTF